MAKENGINKVLMEFTTDSVDWVDLLKGKSGDDIASKVAAGFYRLEALHKDQIYRLAEAHREEVDKLKEQLASEKSAREKREWQHKSHVSDLVRFQEEASKEINTVTKRSSFAVKVAAGGCFFSLLILASFEGHRFVSDSVERTAVQSLHDRVESYGEALLTRENTLGDLVDSKLSATSAEIGQLIRRVDSYDEALLARENALGVLVDTKLAGSSAEIEQLVSRVNSYDESLKAQNAQMKSFMVAQNDKSGAVLKAVDVIKYNQSLTEFWSSDEGKNMIKTIYAWIEEQKQEKK